jgi:hypothetical protein
MDPKTVKIQIPRIRFLGFSIRFFQLRWKKGTESKIFLREGYWMVIWTNSFSNFREITNLKMESGKFCTIFWQITFVNCWFINFKLQEENSKIFLFVHFPFTDDSDPSKIRIFYSNVQPLSYRLLGWISRDPLADQIHSKITISSTQTINYLSFPSPTDQ